MKDIQNISLIFIPYFTICGALYHLTYWETFDLNALSMINVSDIIKSALFPIFPVLLIILYNLLIQNLILPSSADGTFKGFSIKNRDKWVFGTFIIISIISTIYHYYFKNNSPDRFISAAFINFTFFSVFITNSDFLRGYFKTERIRRTVIDILVVIPIVTYYTGKYESAQIFQNIKYKYTLNINEPTNLVQSSDTLKLLGITDKNYIYTDLKNSKIILRKSDNINSLILYQKKR